MFQPNSVEMRNINSEVELTPELALFLTGVGVELVFGFGNTELELELERSFKKIQELELELERHFQIWGGVMWSWSAT